MTDHMSSQPQSQSQFSLVQYTAVRKVLKSDTMFRTLGVTRQASTNTIKRQYKKLSLLVHPDKNAAPGAEEAFKSTLDPCWQIPNHRNNFKFHFPSLLLHNLPPLHY
jgi:DnaJ family protein B protein 12